MSTSATGSADQSGFSVVRMPLRRVSEDSAASGADKNASAPARIASMPDVRHAATPADRTTGDRARSAQAAMESDAELERLRKCLWALHEEIETLPRATQLSPIAGLPLLDARMAAADTAAPDPASRITPPSRRAPRRALSALTLFLIASAIGVPIVGHYGGGSFTRLFDEFDSAVLPIDTQHVALLHLPEPVRTPRAIEIPSAGEAERAAGAQPLQPTDLEDKPAEEETPSQATQGAETSPRADEPTVATPADEAPQSDTAVLLDPEETKPLIERGRQFFDAGDVAAARLLFTRAAHAGDITAAVAMGTTYDPAVLGSRGVRGIVADPQKARSWYEKAAELGSAEGLRLLKALDDQDEEPAAMRQTAEHVDSGVSGADAPFAVNRDQGGAAPRDLLVRRPPAQSSKPKH